MYNQIEVNKGGKNMLENRVREERQKQGLTQFELSIRTRISPPNLSAIERGKLLPWAKARKAISRALKVTEDELFSEVPDNGAHKQ